MAKLQYLPTFSEELETAEYNSERQSSYTYSLDIDRNRIRGMANETDAVLQSVYLILNTERYRYPIYSFDYGVELCDLVGKPVDLVMSEAKRRITEALMQDDRIESVDEWVFETSKSSIIVTFTVHTIYGNIETAKEVSL